MGSKKGQSFQYTKEDHYYYFGFGISTRYGAFPLKKAKGTISLAQAKYVVLGPNHMLKSLWEWIKNKGIKKRI